MYLTIYSESSNQAMLVMSFKFKGILGKSLLKTGAKSEVKNDCNWTRAHNNLVRKRTLNYLAKLAKFFELSCEYLSARCFWLFLLVMWSTHFRVNPHSKDPWMWRKSLLETGAKSEVQVTASGLEPKAT